MGITEELLAKIDALTKSLEAAERHTQEVIADCDEYQRTVAALRAKLEVAERRNLLNPQGSEYVAELEAKLAAAEAVIEAAMNELGVPGDGYPAPVANAYDLLAAYRAKETEG